MTAAAMPARSQPIFMFILLTLKGMGSHVYGVPLSYRV